MPPTFRIGPRTPAPQCRFVREALIDAGWRETRADDWRLYWTATLPGAAQFSRVAGPRLINHIPGIGVLTTKHHLHHALVAARAGEASRGTGRAYQFFPDTYEMPRDYDRLVAAASRDRDALWIRKPRAASRGRGVEMVTDIPAVDRDPRWLVQRYVTPPHLLDGYKYTLRFYVLARSFEPLDVHVFPEGFAKLASRPFTTDPAQLVNRFVHLTNPDVLREDTHRPVPDANLTHAQYRERLRTDGLDDAALFASIRRLIVRTMSAGRDGVCATLFRHGWSGRGCFELLGLDIAVDEALEPWLLECNLGPSLAVEAAPSGNQAGDEHRIKARLVADTLTMAGAIDAGPAAFERVFPAADWYEYLPSFSRVTTVDRLALLEAMDEPPLRLAAWDAVTIPLEAGLEVASSRTGVRQRLNATAAVIWSGLLDGLAPDEIVHELSIAAGIDPVAVRDDVWTVVLEWLRLGLLRRAVPI